MAPRWQAAWWPKEAWSGLKTRYLYEIGCFATTLLASVERCSRPEMFANESVVFATTLASSVVAEDEDVAGRADA